MKTQFATLFGFAIAAPNQVASLDAAMTLLLHVVSHWRGVAEPKR
jgi:hypothetical protein